MSYNNRKSNSGGNWNGGKSQSQSERSGYVGAPYNFIPFSDKVVSYDKELISHASTDSALLSGEISYKIIAKTPILVDDGEASFYRNANGDIAIPGSSVRGMIRSNAQILSFSNFYDDIDDYALMYRNVASTRPDGAKKLKETYNDKILRNKSVSYSVVGGKDRTMSVLMNVRAGYVVLEGNKYRIYDTVLDHVPQDNFNELSQEWNYYILSERHLAEVYCDTKDKKKYPYPFFVKADGGFITMHRLDSKFHKDVKDGRVHYKGTENREDYHDRKSELLYKPYFLPCSYTVNNREITAVSADTNALANKGYVVSSGFMNEKKAIYIIPEIDRRKKIRGKGIHMPIEISDKDKIAFEIDIKKRETTLKTFGGIEVFDLPKKEGEIKPIFYITYGGRLYFGFTPRLRLFYEHTIKDGMPFSMKKDSLDYAKAIFGFSNEDESYKSRVSFSDARLINEYEADKKRHAILGEPKPTSYSDYLIPKKGSAVTYNDQGFALRGVKQYWLRSSSDPIENVAKEKFNEKYVTKMNALKAGTVFEGKVRFHNLAEEELGLLLWSLKLQDNSWMNIGKGKPLGYGNIKLELIETRKFDDQAAYDLSALTLNPYTDIDVEEVISTYQSSLKEKLKLSADKNLDEVEPIRSLLFMKDSEKMPDPKNIRYMEIDKKEFQNRSSTLPTVAQMYGREHGRDVNSTILSTHEESEVVYASKKDEPEYVKIDKKAVLEKSLVYDAVVKGYQGKFIKFRIESLALNDRFAVEDVENIAVTKKTIKEVFCVGAIVKMRCENISDGKVAWKCTGVFKQ